MKEERDFGAKGVLEIIRRHRHDSARQILQALYQAASSFRFEGAQLDDLTAIVCKVEDIEIPCPRTSKTL